MSSNKPEDPLMPCCTVALLPSSTSPLQSSFPNASYHCIYYHLLCVGSEMSTCANKGSL
jgi:hypothetical protein